LGPGVLVLRFDVSVLPLTDLAPSLPVNNEISLTQRMKVYSDTKDGACSYYGAV